MQANLNLKKNKKMQVGNERVNIPKIFASKENATTEEKGQG